MTEEDFNNYVNQVEDDPYAGMVKKPQPEPVTPEPVEVPTPNDTQLPELPDLSAGSSFLPVDAVKENLTEAAEQGDTESVENIVENAPTQAEAVLKDAAPLNKEAEQVVDGNPADSEVENKAVEDFVEEVKDGRADEVLNSDEEIPADAANNVQGATGGEQGPDGGEQLPEEPIATPQTDLSPEVTRADIDFDNFVKQVEADEVEAGTELPPEIKAKLGQLKQHPKFIQEAIERRIKNSLSSFRRGKFDQAYNPSDVKEALLQKNKFEGTEETNKFLEAFIDDPVSYLRDHARSEDLHNPEYRAWAEENLGHDWVNNQDRGFYIRGLRGANLEAAKLIRKYYGNIAGNDNRSNYDIIGDIAKGDFSRVDKSNLKVPRDRATADKVYSAMNDIKTNLNIASILNNPKNKGFIDVQELTKLSPMAQLLVLRQNGYQPGKNLSEENTIGLDYLNKWFEDDLTVNPEDKEKIKDDLSKLGDQSVADIIDALPDDKKAELSAEKVLEMVDQAFDSESDFERHPDDFDFEPSEVDQKSSYDEAIQIMIDNGMSKEDAIKAAKLAFTGKNPNETHYDEKAVREALTAMDMDLDAQDELLRYAQADDNYMSESEQGEVAEFIQDSIEPHIEPEKEEEEKEEEEEEEEEEAKERVLQMLGVKVGMSASVQGPGGDLNTEWHKPMVGSTAGHAPGHSMFGNLTAGSISSGHAGVANTNQKNPKDIGRESIASKAPLPVALEDNDGKAVNISPAKLNGGTLQSNGKGSGWFGSIGKKSTGRIKASGIKLPSGFGHGGSSGGGGAKGLFGNNGNSKVSDNLNVISLKQRILTASREWPVREVKGGKFKDSADRLQGIELLVQEPDKVWVSSGVTKGRAKLETAVAKEPKLIKLISEQL